MSTARWLCEGKECGTMFSWLPETKWAACSSSLGGRKIKIKVFIPGDTKPSRCPKCGGKKIDSMEG